MGLGEQETKKLVKHVLFLWQFTSVLRVLCVEVKLNTDQALLMKDINIVFGCIYPLEAVTCEDGCLHLGKISVYLGTHRSKLIFKGAELL